MEKEAKIKAGDNQKMVISHLKLIDILLVVLTIVLIIRLGITYEEEKGFMWELGDMVWILSILLSWFYLAMAVILAFRIPRNSTFRKVLCIFFSATRV